MYNADIGCANITYEIVAGNAELFTANATTGLVLTTGELDREIRDRYLLTGMQFILVKIIIAFALVHQLFSSVA